MDGDVCLGVWNSRGIPRIDGSGFLTKQKYIPRRERRPGSKKVFHDGERSTYIPLRAHTSKSGLGLSRVPLKKSKIGKPNF